LIDFITNRFFALSGIDLVLALIIQFFYISITGWLVEMVYLGTSGKGIINAGFLQGPFCPAYATGALIIYPFTVLLAPLPLWFQIILFAIMAVVIEYIASLALEKILGLKIWDYSDEPLNLHGRISIKYAFFWFLLVLALVFLLQPLGVLLIQMIPDLPRRIAGSVIFLLIVIDFIYSGIIYGKSSNCIKDIIARMKFPQEESYELQFNRTRIMNEKKRIAELFESEEYRALDEKIMKEIFVSKVFETDPAFHECIKDIIEHPAYISWSKQSEKTALLLGEHMRIAELLWKIAEIKDFDREAAVRGALLAVYHRKILYPREQFGRWLFPQVSIFRWVKKDLFKPAKTEKDIILWYKWPLNLKAPATEEGLIVSFADKIVKSQEFREVLRDLYPEQLAR